MKINSDKIIGRNFCKYTRMRYKHIGLIPVATDQVIVTIIYIILVAQNHPVPLED